MVATGDFGKMWVGHQEAAVLANWRLTHDHDTLNSVTSSLIARTVDRNNFWLSQPFDFRVGLWMGSVWWVWEKAKLAGDSGNRVELLVEGNPVATSLIR